MGNPLIGQRLVTTPVGTGQGTQAPAAGLIIDAYFDLIDALAITVAGLSSLNLIAGTNITLATNPITGAITISSTGGGGGGAPSFGANAIAATLLATQNNFNNNGASGANAWGPTVTKVGHTPLAGGSLITGFDATGFADGQPVMHVNRGSTDTIVIAHQNASSLAANRCNFADASPIEIRPGAAVILYRDNGVWTSA